MHNNNHSCDIRRCSSLALFIDGSWHNVRRVVRTTRNACFAILLKFLNLLADVVGMGTTTGEIEIATTQKLVYPLNCLLVVIISEMGGQRFCSIKH